MITELKKVTINNTKTSDVLYDTKYNHFCVFSNVDDTPYDWEYITKNCLKIIVKK